MIYYAITPYHDKKSLQAIGDKAADFIAFRNKTTKSIKEDAKAFLDNLPKEHKVKTFLSEHYLLAKELGFYGVHLTSSQYFFIPEAKRRGLKVIISCHTEAEIEEAIRKKVDFITYSPIFASPDKGAPKGIEDLQQTVLRYNIPIIALGGIITKEQIEAVKEAGAVGFASIRYFTGG
jgi:thiamine-phosphate pyrophosphorylase